MQYARKAYHSLPSTPSTFTFTNIFKAGVVTSAVNLAATAAETVINANSLKAVFGFSRYDFGYKLAEVTIPAAFGAVIDGCAGKGFGLLTMLGLTTGAELTITSSGGFGKPATANFDKVSFGVDLVAASLQEFYFDGLFNDNSASTEFPA